MPMLPFYWHVAYHFRDNKLGRTGFADLSMKCESTIQAFPIAQAREMISKTTGGANIVILYWQAIGEPQYLDEARKHGEKRHTPAPVLTLVKQPD